MPGRWDQKGLPHKGWDCVGVEDLGEDDSADDSGFATCEMCGQERVRYVHIMEHPKIDHEVRVGCICAGHMSGDYVGAKRRETVLRNKAARRSKWLTRKWRVSVKGNHFLNISGTNLGVHKAGNRWGYRIDARFGPGRFETMEEAKLALFEDYWQSSQEVEEGEDQ